MDTPMRENVIARSWRTYRSLPLHEQFKWEWVAFGILAVAWSLFCIGVFVGAH